MFLVTVPLFTQVYKWIPANLLRAVTLRWTSIPSMGGEEILLVASCYRTGKPGNRDKLRPDGPLGSHHRRYLPYHCRFIFRFITILVPRGRDPSAPRIVTSGLSHFLSMRRVLRFQPIRFVRFENQSVNRGRPVLEVAIDLDSWC